MRRDVLVGAILGVVFGVLLMIVDELMVRLAEGHVDYDVPIVGHVSVWVAWWFVFAGLLVLFVVANAKVIS